GHGIVVVGTKLQRLVQVIDTFLDVGSIFLFYGGTNFLVLGRQGVLGLQAEFGAFFLTQYVSLSPVNNRDRVIRLGVIRIDLGSLLVVLLSQVEFLHLQIEIGDALNAVDVPGIPLPHFLVRLNAV